MNVRDRIKELRRVKASELRPHPENWRTRPREQQSALLGVLEEVGIADACIAYEEDGQLILIDGHLRQETMPDEILPVLVLDVNAEEAQKLLLTMNPLAGMATADAGKLDSLLADVQTESDAVRQLLEDLAAENGLSSESSEPVRLTPIDVKPPPKMAWILVGIPLVRFGEISEIVESLADVPDLVFESTVNDG